MIKANQDKEIPAATLSYTPKQLDSVMGNLMFPIDVKGRDARIRVDQLRRDISSNESNLKYHKENVISYEANLEESNRLLAEEEPKLPEQHKPTPERAAKEMDAVSRIPWIEDVTISNGNSLIIKTRPGILKTILQKRMVDFGGANTRTEFLAEPVIVPLPQYSLYINLTHMGYGRWANNAGNLAIQMINPADASKFIGGKVLMQEARAHWAAGSAGIGNWSALCLGEYEKDLQNSSVKGLTDLLVTIAGYLQTSGDEHAYVAKERWTLSMGNPAYNEYAYRLAGKGETPEEVDERYKLDYKKFNAVEFPENAKVNPGEGSTAEVVNLNTVDYLFVDAIRGFNRRPLMYSWDTVTPEPIEEGLIDCVCVNSSELIVGCNCEGLCECHVQYARNNP